MWSREIQFKTIKKRGNALPKSNGCFAYARTAIAYMSVRVLRGRIRIQCIEKGTMQYFLLILGELLFTR